MAERRMFHTAVVESDAFLDLPAGAQALYFHLGMHADDDGFVNGPRQIARKLRRPFRELKLLTDSGFLLDFDGIMVLRHWLVGNTLRLDRMKPLNYPNIAQQIYITGNRLYSLQPQGESENLLELRQKKLATKCQPKVREGKVSKGKLREGKVMEDKIKEDNLREHNTAVAVVPEEPELSAAPADTDCEMNYMKGKLGKGVVLLSAQQMEDLLEKMGLDSFDYYVEKLADFLLSRQAKVKNHYATILKWWQEDRGICV